MALSLKPERLKRYRDLARFLIKYGRSDIVRQARLSEVVATEELDAAPAEVEALADDLATDLEKLGPTFIKLGQLLSSRPDILPPVYTEALARLQDRVEPFAFEEVERIINSELGTRPSRVFLDFEATPTAAASLGQVHRATLRNGRAVVVKVQRPAIRAQVADDLEMLEELAEFAQEHTDLGRRYALVDTLDQFRRSLLRELDYQLEAQHLATLRENLRDFASIVVPAPVRDLTTSRVLVMDYVPGRKITAVSPVRRTEIDGRALADDLFRAYLQQILVDGFFHADPHPGNVFLTEDGRIALLDLGMTGRITPALQDELLKMVLAVSESRGDEVAEIVIRTGEVRPMFEEHAYRREIAQLVAAHRGATAAQIQVGRIVLEVTRIAGERGVRPTPELSLLGKALLNLDQVGRTLDPEFDPTAAVRRHTAGIMHRRLLQKASPSNVLTSVLEMNELIQGLPGRLNRVLDNFAENHVEIRVKLDEELWMMASMQKIANRITLGLVLAALIVGAAMLMQVDTEYTIFGYPAIAMIFFVVAAVGGLILVVSILRHDPKGDLKERM